MTTTTALLLNAILMAGVVGALAAVVRLAHRLPHARRHETLHPSRPLELRVALAQSGDTELPRAA